MKSIVQNFSSRDHSSFKLKVLYFVVVKRKHDKAFQFSTYGKLLDACYVVYTTTATRII